MQFRGKREERKRHSSPQPVKTSTGERRIGRYYRYLREQMQTRQKRKKGEGDQLAAVKDLSLFPVMPINLCV